MDNLLGSYLATSQVADLDITAKERVDGLNLAPLSVYFIDSAIPDVLPFLASQFDMLGYNGWVLADTVAKQRALLKRAFEFKRHHGTPWVIKEVLKLLGYTDVIIREGVDKTYNGTFDYDGTETYSGGTPFEFRIEITVPDSFALTAEVVSNTIQIVNHWKNCRSHLADVAFIIGFSDGVGMADSFDDFSDNDFTSQIGQGINYNGSFTYNGAHSHNRLADVCVLTITDGTTVNYDVI